MSMVERSTRRHGSEEEAQPRRRPLFRWVAAGSAALFLMASSYQVAWGDHPGTNRFHEPIREDDDDDDGLSGGAIAAIVIGGLAAGYGLWLLLAGADDDDEEEEEQQKVQNPSLDKSASISGLRLVAAKQMMEAGERNTFSLQARSATDGKWHSVTAQEGASIEVKDGSLVRQDGSKNAFCLPITASVDGGKQVVVEGRFQNLSTRTTVQLVAGS